MTRASLASLASLVLAAAAAAALLGCRDETRPAPVDERKWQLLASELPAALMSVSARSASDVYAVGADKGHGPMVLHFDGTTWRRLDTGQRGDLWWVQALPDGPVLMGGAGALLLRYDGARFERLEVPGALGKQTVYGVWGTAGDTFYAVGSAAGRDGFVWRYRGGAFEKEPLPRDLPRMANGEVPGFFKVWGKGEDVWVVGAGGSILHRTGAAPFAVVPPATKDTLFTIHGAGDRRLTVGGAGNGVLLEGTGGAFHVASPSGAGLLQGIFATEKDGDWASGERGLVYARAPGAASFTAVDHGLVLPAASSLHAITVDADGGVWSVGGNVLGPALDDGMLVHYGRPVPIVTLDEDDRAEDAGAPSCPPDVVAAGRDKSIARRWNEQALAAIRRDLPRPTVHARNLFHVSAAMWDAWAAYDPKATGVFFDEKHAASDVSAARSVAISVAAYDVLAHRYARAVGAPTTLACLRAVMTDLHLDPDDAHVAGDDPIAVGHRAARAVIEGAADDGANEANDCADPAGYTARNAPLVFDAPGAPLTDPDHWQPLNLSVAATQNGIVLPAGVQEYVGSQWGGVRPFAMRRASDAVPWHDAGAAPKVDDAMKALVVEVIRKTASLDPSDPTTIDVSPAAYGHNSLGANDGKGWPRNPVTGKPYAPQVVKLADFARVMAEFWADGPRSETPPGHWNTIANSVSDAPGFARRLFGTGEPLDPLAWDVHVYLALNGAEHDAAISAWDLKRRTQSSRPISLVRWMGGKGQSSDPKGPSYDPRGLPLVPGLIEVVTAESSAPGERHAGLAPFVGQIAVRDWLGEPGDRAKQVSGVGWVRAVDWITYQRRTFVTPAFPAFVSGHSTFSRAGAEVLASLTGSPYFPGGLGEFVAPKDTFLTFERGPTTEVRLQWASYYDAADQAGQSRLWGGIHVAPDDFGGRRVGHQVGLDAVATATRYFDGTARGGAGRPGSSAR
jgi:hypothetical protein